MPTTLSVAGASIWMDFNVGGGPLVVLLQETIPLIFMLVQDKVILPKES